MPIDDPELVRREYADERALDVRMWANRELAEGVSAEDLVVEAVAEVAPVRVLEVGCGRGEIARRIESEVGAGVVALDLSERMVQLARKRGVEASLGDVQELPVPDGAFDCAVAAWMLYHVPDLDRALRELHRSLRPGGRLVAATFGETNLQELWQLLDDDVEPAHSFTRENGAAALGRVFGRVELRDAPGTINFPDREAVRRYVAASIRRRHLVERLPAFDGPFSARSSQTVFVAEKT